MNEREVELGILGAILKNPKNFGSVSELVKPDYLTWVPYRDCYEAMLVLHSEGLAIDTITVGDQLEKQGKLAEFSIHDSPSLAGRNALVEVRQKGRGENYATYAQIAKNYALNREILQIASKGAEWAVKGRSPFDIVSDMTNLLGKVEPSSKSETITFNQAVSKAWDDTEAAMRGEKTFLKTGITALDELMIGLSAPDLTIVAARPSVGKTAFLATSVYNIMRAYPDKAIVFFSLEMGSAQVAMRFISMHSGIPYATQQTGEFKYGEYERFVQTIGELTGANPKLHLNDIAGIKPKKIRQELRKVGKVDLVVVDYIQLANADDKKESRRLEVGSVSRELKAIAREFDVPVLVAAQLSRAANQRSEDNKKPVLSDLAESGSLEQDADNVIFLHRDFGVTSTNVIFAKHRNGPVGDFFIEYEPNKTMFRDK